MNIARLIIIVSGIGLLSGCSTFFWDVRQVETTFVNQENNEEYVQKNAVLVNRKTGKTWVLSSDQDSNYFWVEMPVRSLGKVE